MPPIRERLRAEFPEEFFADDADTCATFGRDWTKVYEPNPLGIVFPKTTEEVSRLLGICNELGQPVVPSGGRTGLAGGAVAKNRELVLSLSRMRRVDPIDLVGHTIRVQAGVVTEEVHHAAGEHGLTWPVDFASKGSSVVGGNIATNAGGVRVIRYGLTREWVLGLQVVLPNGEVLELGGGLEKNNTGIDLRQLFIGSEGVLGVITEATLKLTRVPSQVDVMLLAVDDLAAVLQLFREANRAPFTIAAYEFFTDKCLARVLRHRNVRAPVGDASHYVLIEAEAATGLEEWLGAQLESGLVKDGTLAQTANDQRDLWVLREGISESLSATGLPHKNDIALPIASLEAFTREFNAFFESQYPGWEICLFGHVGDGNLHVNVMKPDSLEKAEFLRHAKDADRHLFALVQKHKGSISAEHGIGLLKKDFLSFSRTDTEIALFRELKRVFDPKGILNPGKVF